MKALDDAGKIVFFGDSITEWGGRPGGYVTLVTDRLKSKYGARAPVVLNAGISGNKVPDLLARLEHDVLRELPALVVIYIGINDVWHFSSPEGAGTPKNIYESDLKEIVLRIKSAGSKVLLCTPSVIGEKANGENPQDDLLDEYSEVSRNVARETGTAVCDLHTAFIDYLKIHNTANLSDGLLTVDGVHLNDAGNALVARSIIEFLES